MAKKTIQDQIAFERQHGERHTCEVCHSWISDLAASPHCYFCGEHHNPARRSCEEVAEARKAEDLN